MGVEGRLVVHNGRAGFYRTAEDGAFELVARVSSRDLSSDSALSKGVYHVEQVNERRYDIERRGVVTQRRTLVFAVKGNEKQYYRSSIELESIE